MKKGYVVLITVAIETIVLWLVSLLVGWVFIDTIFLGGLAIFGCVWFFRLYINETNNEYNATVRGWYRQDTGTIKTFEFIMSPITWGLLLFTVVSFLITIITYYPYFV